jgi:hypothetical protein
MIANSYLIECSYLIAACGVGRSEVLGRHFTGSKELIGRGVCEMDINGYNWINLALKSDNHGPAPTHHHSGPFKAYR